MRGFFWPQLTSIYRSKNWEHVKKTPWAFLCHFHSLNLKTILFANRHVMMHFLSFIFEQFFFIFSKVSFLVVSFFLSFNLKSIIFFLSMAISLGISFGKSCFTTLVLPHPMKGAALHILLHLDHHDWNRNRKQIWSKHFVYMRLSQPCKPWPSKFITKNSNIEHQNLLLRTLGRIRKHEIGVDNQTW